MLVLLFCVFTLTSFVCATEDTIIFEIFRNKTDYADVFYCKNDRDMYYVQEDSYVTIMLNTTLPFISMECCVGGHVDNCNQGEKFKENIKNYSMQIKIKQTLNDYLRCNLLGQRNTSDYPEATASCLAYIETMDMEGEQEVVDPDKKVGALINVRAIIQPNNVTSVIYIGYQDYYRLNVECWNPNTNKSDRKILCQSDFNSEAIIEVTELLVSGFRTESKYYCKEIGKNKEQRNIPISFDIQYNTTLSDNNDRTSEHHRTYKEWAIALSCAFLLAILFCIAFVAYKTFAEREKIIKRHSTLRGLPPPDVKRSSSQESNRVTYVELQFEPTTGRNVISTDSTPYATVIGVMAPNTEPDEESSSSSEDNTDKT